MYRIITALVFCVLCSVAQESTPQNMRNPFTAPERTSVRNRNIQDMVLFGVSDTSVSNIRWDYLPRILVTGIIAAKNTYIACAEVEKVGNVTLQVGDRMLIPQDGADKGTKSAWFQVIKIEKNAMAIQLDDGSVVSGRLF